MWIDASIHIYFSFYQIREEGVQIRCDTGLQRHTERRLVKYQYILTYFSNNFAG